MKKRLLKNAMLRKRIWLRKMFLRMNYLFCLLVLGALSVSAEVYSQNGLVSLKMKDVSLVKVFNEITKGAVKESIKEARKINLNFCTIMIWYKIRGL